MKLFNITWIIWLICIFIWNFGWPKADPLDDVIVAIILSIIFYQINIYKKNQK